MIASMAYSSALGVALAVDAGKSSDPLTGLLTYGPLGIMVVLLVTGLLVPGPTHNRIVKENDRLRELIDNKVYPTIAESSSATKEASEVMKEVLRLLPPDMPTTRPRRRTVE